MNIYIHQVDFLFAYETYQQCGSCVYTTALHSVTDSVCIVYLSESTIACGYSATQLVTSPLTSAFESYSHFLQFVLFVQSTFCFSLAGISALFQPFSLFRIQNARWFHRSLKRADWRRLVSIPLSVHIVMVFQNLILLFPLIFSHSRFITLFANTDSTSGSNSFDLRTLRAVRVLRPLKLVSGIPSMYNQNSSLAQTTPTNTAHHITWTLFLYKSILLTIQRASYSAPLAPGCFQDGLFTTPMPGCCSEFYLLSAFLFIL